MYRLQNSRGSTRASKRLILTDTKTTISPPANQRVGRFAPTPSGDLHIGSLVAVIASAADIKSNGGRHRVRIDDIDPPRVVKGSAERIIQALTNLSVPIDGRIIWQSESIARYQHALTELIEHDAVFVCSCSRKSLNAKNECVAHCRKTRLSNQTPIGEQLQQLLGHSSVRLDTKSLLDHDGLCVVDEIQPQLCVEDVTTLGTPVLWRKDGYVSYLLATAVDDSDDITDVVRGADLWQETACQQLVMECLRRRVPRWVHVPCAVDHQNQKLGKQTRAPSIHSGDSLMLLQKVWLFLGQSPLVCGNLSDFWAHAAATWCAESIPQVLAQRID